MSNPAQRDRDDETSLTQRIEELEAFVGRIQELLDHDFTSDSARIRAIQAAAESGPQGAKSLAEFTYRAEVAQRIALARPGDAKAAQVVGETQREAELARQLEEEREINNQLRTKEVPPETGVGDLCAPGPVDSQVPAFVLRYEDQDRPDLVIYDRGEARAAFATSEARGWNCYLFEVMKRHEPESFQSRVRPWLLECFGAVVAADTAERTHRFLEESLELAQACGCTAAEARQLVDYVFGRPVGEKPQEVGGVMVTLAALCLALGIDMRQAGEDELASNWCKVDQIRTKHQSKPAQSPLPGASGPPEPIK